jgi:replication-associated recombination protein RarA
MLRALESHERAHTLLIGPPACAKSMFMLEIEEYMSSKVYFAEGSGTSKAGLQKFISENQHKEIIIIDEVDKMPMKDQEGLLTMMERAAFTSTKVRNTKTVKADIVIFATSNSTERLSKPLLSRFTVFGIPPYTYEQFEGIALRIVNRLHPSTVIQIASSVWKTGSRDIRDVLKIAKLCNPSDIEEDIIRLISIHQKYHKTGRDYN